MDLDDLPHVAMNDDADGATGPVPSEPLSPETLAYRGTISDRVVMWGGPVAAAGAIADAILAVPHPDVARLIAERDQARDALAEMIARRSPR